MAFILSFLWGVLLTAVSQGFLGAFFAPLGLLSLPVIVIVATHLRLAHLVGHAFALGAGLVLEVMHFGFHGLFVGYLFLVSLLVSFVVQKVFTHFSLLSICGVHFFAALLWYAMIIVRGFSLQQLSFGVWGGLVLVHMVLAVLITLMSWCMQRWKRAHFLVKE